MSLPSPFYRAKFILAALSLGLFSAQSQCLPNFGAASHFALFTVSGAVGNTGMSNITGNIGTNVGAITGFEAPSVVNGTVEIANPVTSSAASDLLLAHDQLFSMPATDSLHAPAFGTGETLLPGVYAIGSAGSAGGVLTLDGNGDPEAIFVFKIGGAFTTNASTTIILANGTVASNVFWIAEGAIAMGAGTTMHGTLVANNGAISMGDQGILHGRMYSTTGAVSVYGTVLDVSGIESVAYGGNVFSSQSICAGSPAADLVLTQSTGIVVKWQKATEPSFASPIDIAVTANTLTSAQIGALMQTTYFRAQLQRDGCNTTYAFSSAAQITISTTVWDGLAWSNLAPTLAVSAVISADFTSNGDFAACALVVTNGAHVEILGGDTVTLGGALTIEDGGTFILHTDANLLQLSDVQNTGDIIVRCQTASLMRLDYVMWSSPVSGQLLQPFSPLTLPNRFYTFNPDTAVFNTVADPSTTEFSPGLAYLIRMPDNHPTTPLQFTGEFEGNPANGEVIVNVGDGTYNAVGNPYPSGLSLDAFMSGNSIGEALYFWRKTNNAANSSYAVYTSAGSTSNSSSDPWDLAPQPVVVAGQGFIVKSTSPQIIFNNSMRAPTSQEPLLRNDNDTSRLWLALSRTDGFYSQTLIAYMPQATTGADAAIDGRFINDSGSALTSLINGVEYSIQGRPAFGAGDVVALGFKSAATAAYTISLHRSDGLFAAGQNVYLRDVFLNIVHDIKASDYTFSTPAGTFDGRFEILYQSVLSTNQHVLIAPNVTLYKQGRQLVVNSGQTTMVAVYVYDLLGRLLTKNTRINAPETKFSGVPQNQVLVVKVVCENGETVSKKVVN